MKNQYFLFLLVTSLGFAQLTPPPELQSYYSGVDFENLSGMPLYDDLAVETISNHSTFLAYAERHNYLYEADEDLANPLNVILIYSGESRSETEYLSGNNPNMPQTFNTEHVYPQSLIDNTARGDLHHLRSCDVAINSARGNDPFTAGSGIYGSTGSAWYPGDEWKGDVARMILYMNLRYNESMTDVGSLNLFLQWNADDPVSAFEENRNNVISSAQGNRNPFIDNPFIATAIWGGAPAENRWENLSVNESMMNSIKILPNPVSGEYLYFNTPLELHIEIYSLLGKKTLKANTDASHNYIDVSPLKPGVYLMKIRSGNLMITKKLVRQ